MDKHLYTPEEIDFIRRELPGRSHAELTERFNAEFGLNLTCTQITTAAKNRKIRNGRDTRLRPGNVPFNKGRKGHCPEGCKAGWFQPGNRPANYRPVGSERITGGYIEVKVADPNKWRLKQRVVWEALHGPVPAGHTVVFGDGNRLNLDPDNLVLVSRRQLAVINKLRLTGGSVELTKSGQAVADLCMAITDRRKGVKFRQKKEAAHV